MKPTRERMMTLWDEMQEWPLAEAAAFAKSLLHNVMVQSRQHCIDVGHFDPVAAEEVYIVAARGDEAMSLQDAIRRWLATMDRNAGVLKLGEKPTPMTEGVDYPSA